MRRNAARIAIALVLTVGAAATHAVAAEAGPGAPAISLQRPHVGGAPGGRVVITLPARYAPAGSGAGGIVTARVTATVRRHRRRPVRGSSAQTIRLPVTTASGRFAHRLMLGAGVSRRIRAAAGRRPRIAVKAVVTRRVDRNRGGRVDSARRVARSFPRIRLEGGGDAEQALRDRIGRGGAVSPRLAVDEFSTLIAPLPGGRMVPGALPRVRSATSAVRHVLRHWHRLTPAQRRAIEAVLAPAAPPSARAAQTTEFEALVSRFVTEVGQRTGRPLRRPVVVEEGDSQIIRDGGTVLAYVVPARRDQWGNWEPQPSGETEMDTCLITLTLDGQVLDSTELRATLAHEVFHCWQHEVLGLGPSLELEDWLAEGSAEWVGEELGGPSSIGRGEWRTWLTDPVALFERSYDALGFFAQLARAGVDVWSQIAAVMARTASTPAFRHAVSLAPSNFLADLATGPVRRPAWGAEWDVAGIPVARGVRREPAQIRVAPGAAATRSLPPAMQFAFDIRAPRGSVVVVTVTRGHGALRLPGRGTAGTTIPIAGDLSGEICIGGECRCAAGSSTATGASPVLAVTSAAEPAKVTLSVKECDVVDAGLTTLGYWLELPRGALAPVGPASGAAGRTIHWNLSDGVDCRDFAGNPVSVESSCLVVYATRKRPLSGAPYEMPLVARSWPTTFMGVHEPGVFAGRTAPASDADAYAFDAELARAHAHCRALPLGRRDGVTGYWPISEKLAFTRLAVERHPWYRISVATRVRVVQVTQWVPHGSLGPVGDSDCTPRVEVVRSVTLQTAAADRARMDRERREGPPRGNPEHVPHSQGAP